MPDWLDLLAECHGFQWDDGNAAKNWASHAVSQAEAEQVFFNRPLRIAPDAAHSIRERRFAALGKTDQARLLTIVFTIRERKVRVISARAMSRRERGLYEHEA